MKLLALVLAGGEGTRLHPLTAQQAKPALPFAQGRRIVDFVLSNLVNSEIDRICVLAQYKPESLVTHIENAWAVRPDVAIETIVPRTGPYGLRYRGTADAVYRNLDVIRRHAPDLVAVFAADHVYRMDVRQMVEFHLRKGAEVTVAAVPVPLDAASSFGIVQTDGDDRIVEFIEKPRNPEKIPACGGHVLASMGNYLFAPGILVSVLGQAAERGEADFGRDILPRLAGNARIFAYDFTRNRVPGVQRYEEPGYWRDVGTLESLFAARNDVTGPHPRFNLRNPYWPIHGTEVSRLQRVPPSAQRGASAAAS